MNRIKPSISIFLGAVLIHGAIASADDWPFFRGPSRNGFADVKFTPLDDPEILWKVNLGLEGDERRGAPVVAKGKVYVHGGRVIVDGRPDGRFVKLFCLDARTGKEIWKSEHIGRTDTTPAVDVKTGRVYSFGGERVVRCFDSESGRLVWASDPLPQSTRDRSWGHSGSPVLWEDLIFVNVGYGAALKQSNGEVAWQFPGWSGMATPVLFSRRGKPALAIFCGDKLVARDARTGAELFSIPWVTDWGVNAPDPVIFENGNRLFLSSAYKEGRALYDISGTEPKELWHYTQQENYGAHAWFSAVYHDGHIYAVTDQGAGLACVDPADGRLIWRKNEGGYLLNLGGQFVLATQRGEIQIAELSPEYRVISRAQVAAGQTWNVPAYWEGKLYTRNTAGDLFCARISH